MTEAGFRDGMVLFFHLSHFLFEQEGLCRTEAEEGGETVFPEADTKVTGPEWSDCAKQGLAVKTKKGDALLFYR